MSYIKYRLRKATIDDFDFIFDLKKKNFKKYIEEYFSSYKIFFTFDKTTSNETFLLKRKLKDLGSIEELNDILISTNTIIFKISEKKLISPYFVLASTKIKSIKKIKSDIFGNEEIIENEKREPLLEK